MNAAHLVVLILVENSSPSPAERPQYAYGRPAARKLDDMEDYDHYLPDEHFPAMAGQRSQSYSMAAYPNCTIHAVACSMSLNNAHISSL